MDYFPMKLVLVLLHVRQLQQNVIKPVKAGLVQALGVFIDTIVICSCTAMIMLLVPEKWSQEKKEWIFYRQR